LILGAFTFHFGARDRLVAAAARCKKSPKYNPTVEDDLLIGMPDQAPQANQPTFRGTSLGGGINRLDWDKNGWTGVKVRARRKGDATWTDLGIDLQSPMMDKMALLVANQPEVREYQMQYLNGDEPIGDWSDIVQVVTT
jgi:hypothetical protein